MSQDVSKMTIYVLDEDRQFLNDQIIWGLKKPVFIFLVNDLVRAIKKAGPSVVEAIVLKELELRNISPALRKIIDDEQSS